MFSAGLIVALVLIIFAPLLVRFFYPNSFGPAVLALRILAIAQVLAFISLLFNTLLIIQRKERTGLALVIFGACLNIGLNFLLIPKFSLYGSAWATVIAELFNLFLLQYFTVWGKPKNMLANIVILTAVNTLIFFIFRRYGLTNNLLAGTAVLLTNLLILFTVKLLERQDIELFINPFIAKFKTLKQ
jgi:O-antigen/teichoic acid export membrane protein